MRNFLKSIGNKFCQFLRNRVDSISSNKTDTETLDFDEMYRDSSIKKYPKEYLISLDQVLKYAPVGESLRTQALKCFQESLTIDPNQPNLHQFVSDIINSQIDETARQEGVDRKIIAMIDIPD